MRFSPVQRFYLPVYLQSTVGVLQGSGPEYVKWIEKRAPGKAWEIADPGDLVPVKEGTASFELSKPALSQGWTELGYTARGTFQQQETRDYLETNVFGGHSFLFLVLQPFELILVGWMCWKFFDSWRNNLARERGLHWDPQYVPHTLGQDLELLTGPEVACAEAADGGDAGSLCDRKRNRFTVRNRESRSVNPKRTGAESCFANPDKGGRSHTRSTSETNRSRGKA